MQARWRARWLAARVVLRLTELQRAGGKRLPVAEFLRGHDIKAGMMFETAAP
jgi:methionyl-tRNA formyltransferase